MGHNGISDRRLRLAWIAGERKLRQIAKAKGEDSGKWMPLEKKWNARRAELLPSMREVARSLGLKT